MLRRMAKDLGTGVDMGRSSEYPHFQRAGFSTMIAVKGGKMQRETATSPPILLLGEHCGIARNFVWHLAETSSS